MTTTIRVNAAAHGEDTAAAYYEFRAAQADHAAADGADASGFRAYAEAAYYLFERSASRPRFTLADLRVGTVVTARPWLSATRRPEIRTGVVTGHLGDHVTVWFPALGVPKSGAAHQLIVCREVLTTAPLSSRSRRTLARLARRAHGSHPLRELAAALRDELTIRQ